MLSKIPAANQSLICKSASPIDIFDNQVSEFYGEQFNEDSASDDDVKRDERRQSHK